MRARILYCVIPELERVIKSLFNVVDVKIDVIYSEDQVEEILRGEENHGKVEQREAGSQDSGSSPGQRK